MSGIFSAASGLINGAKLQYRWVKASPKLQVLWGVQSVRWSKRFDQKWNKKGTVIKWLKAEHSGSEEDLGWAVPVDMLQDGARGSTLSPMETDWSFKVSPLLNSQL